MRRRERRLCRVDESMSAFFKTPNRAVHDDVLVIFWVSDALSAELGGGDILRRLAPSSCPLEA